MKFWKYKCVPNFGWHRPTSWTSAILGLRHYKHIFDSFPIQQIHLLIASSLRVDSPVGIWTHVQLLASSERYTARLQGLSFSHPLILYQFWSLLYILPPFFIAILPVMISSANSARWSVAVLGQSQCRQFQLKWCRLCEQLEQLFSACSAQSGQVRYGHVVACPSTPKVTTE